MGPVAGHGWVPRAANLPDDPYTSLRPRFRAKISTRLAAGADWTCRSIRGTGPGTPVTRAPVDGPSVR